MAIAVPILVNTDVWDKAGWLGMAFFRPEGRPPALGFLFADVYSGAEIFEHWRRSIGAEDRDELLRVSIIEGDIPGRSAGYTVHVCTDVDAALRKVRNEIAATGDSSLDLDVDGLLGGHVAKRMETPNTESLDAFKSMRDEAGLYSLVPVFRFQGSWAPDYGLGIVKRNLVLRKASEVTERDDPDYALVQPK